MKKRFLALALALVMVFVLAACGEGETTATPTPEATEAVSTGPADVPDVEASANLDFGTGSTTGTYYGFGSTFGTYISNNTGVTITAVSTAGSQANIEMVDAGEYDLGFVQSDVMDYAYNGTRLFVDKDTGESAPVTNFSTVAALYMEQVQIVTLDPNIKTVADLEGKNVSIGANGSGVYFNALDILGAYDLTEEDITPQYQDFATSVDSLKDGKIDAAFIVAGAPTTAVVDLASGNDVYLVSLDDEHIDKLIASSPYYSKNVIAADVYGTPEDCTTVAVGAVVIAGNDVSEDAVYDFVSTVFENIGDLGHAKQDELSLEFASSVTNVPYHPGAAKYFAEKGIEVPTA